MNGNGGTVHSRCFQVAGDRLTLFRGGRRVGARHHHYLGDSGLPEALLKLTARISAAVIKIVDHQPTLPEPRSFWIILARHHHDGI